MFMLLLTIIYIAFIGLGCAPVYPCIIHSTPHNFGAENSQSIIGIQMACAYLGTTLMPPAFGILTKAFGTSIFPYYLIIFSIIMIVSSEKLNSTILKNQPVQ